MKFGSNEKLVEAMAHEGYLKTPSLIDAFKAIDRKFFIPEELQSRAHENVPFPIGFGQTISQPITVAFMLELLSPKPGEKVLEIGSGSGWLTTLLAHVVSLGTHPGKVTALERVRKIKKMTEENVEKFGFISNGVVKIYEKDGSLGSKRESPFDKIIVSASARKIFDVWKEELKIGGRIVCPVGSSIVVMDKISPSEFDESEYFGFNFVPLIEG